MEFHCFCRQGGARWEASWSENTAQGTFWTNCSHVICRTQWGRVDEEPRRNHSTGSLVKSKAAEFLAGVGNNRNEKKLGHVETECCYLQAGAFFKSVQQLFTEHLIYCVLWMRGLSLALKGSMPHCYLLVIFEI